jgi:hypothetical protein
MIGNLCRRCTVPTSPMLRFAPLLPRCHTRIPLRHARIPLVVSRPSSTTLSDSTLVTLGELKIIPLSTPNFNQIRKPGFAYFDRTKYISELHTEDRNVQLVCRPRRFGKSLTVSMLRHFHGFQYRKQYGELFEVCGMLSGQDLHAHITYTKVRVSASIKLSKMAQSNLDSILSWNLTSPTSSVLPKLTILWSPSGKK